MAEVFIFIRFVTADAMVNMNSFQFDAPFPEIFQQDHQQRNTVSTSGESKQIMAVRNRQAFSAQFFNCPAHCTGLLGAPQMAQGFSLLYSGLLSSEYVK